MDLYRNTSLCIQRHIQKNPKMDLWAESLSPKGGMDFPNKGLRTMYQQVLPGTPVFLFTLDSTLPSYHR